MTSRWGLGRRQADAVTKLRAQDRKRRGRVNAPRVESLEQKILLAYSTTAFAVNPITNIGAVTITDSAGSNTNLVVFPQGGFLAHTGDGNTGGGAGQFATQFDWDSTVAGVQPLAADPGSSLSINSGDGNDTVTFGNASFPSSAILAPMSVSGIAGGTKAVTLDDSASSTPNSAYSYNGITLAGPGVNIVTVGNVQNSGVTIKGATLSATGNTYTIPSTFIGEPVFIVGGPNNDTANIQGNNSPVSVDLAGGAGNVVNVGNAGLLTGINGPVNVSDSGGQTTLNINDQADAGPLTTATITNNSFTGLSGGAINYGAGVSSLVVNSGPGVGGFGFNFNVNSSAAATPITFNPIGLNDVVNIGNGDLGTVLGAIIVNGNNETFVNLNDGGNIGDWDYTITNNSASRTGGFGGLTYGGLDALTLNASNGDDHVLVSSTAIGTQVTVNLVGGIATVDVGNPIGGDLDALPASVTVNGNFATTVNLNDTGAPFSDTYTITNASVDRIVFGGLFYNNIVALNINAQNILGASGNNTFDVNSTNFFTTTTLNANDGNDRVNVNSTTGPLFVNLGSGDDTLAFADGVGLSGGSADGGAGVNTLDYSGYTSNIFIDLSANFVSTIAGSYTATNFQNATGGSGDDQLIGDAQVNVLDGGPGNDFIQGKQGNDILFGGDGDDTFLWNPGDGTDTVDGGPGSNVQIVNGTNGPNVWTVTKNGTHTDFNGGPFSLDLLNIQQLQLNALGGDDLLTVDFVNGSPYDNLTGAFGDAGIVFDGGAGADLVKMLASGGVYQGLNEDYFADGPGAGRIYVDGGQLRFFNLEPVDDTVPVVNFTFHGPIGSNTTNIVDAPGPVNGIAPAARIISGDIPSHFERIDFANKTNATVWAEDTGAGTNDQEVILNNPIGAQGLATLTVNTGDGQDNVHIGATPGNAGFVSTSVNTGNDHDEVDVLGAGIAAGTTLFLNGGPGDTDVLRYDAGGVNVTITPTGIPGQVVIGRAGSGDTVATEFEKIIITNQAPTPPIPGLPLVINSVEGFRLVDAIVATFTSAAPGAKAADFTATIDFGDGSATQAGEILQDANNPSVFHVLATHTFVEQGTFNVTTSVASSGSSSTTTVNGVEITTVSGPVAAVTFPANTASVTNAPLAVSVFPITGTENLAIPAGPIATFIDAGGADPVADYNARIEVFNQAGGLVVSIPNAFIVQNSNTNSYTVFNPGFTLNDVGNYTVRVTVTDLDLPAPVTVAGQALVLIADAPITSANSNFNGGIVEGNSITRGVGTFTDFGGLEPLSAYTIKLNWGDGSPSSAGTIIGFVVNVDGSVTYTVQGTHTYAEEGNFPFSFEVSDLGGSASNTNSSPLTVNVADATLSGTGLPFTATEGTAVIDMPIARLVDLNPLAGASDFTVSIDWGDGSPLDTTSGGAVLVGGTATSSIFRITGSHTYAQVGSYPITVTVNDAGGQSVVIASTANVLDAALTAQGAFIQAVEGIQTTVDNKLVATFNSANPLETVLDYTTLGGSVTVDWGDGSISSTSPIPGQGTVTITKSGDLFRVVATKPFPYAEEGSYQVTTHIVDRDGSEAIAHGEADVADAPLSSAGLIQPAIVTIESPVYPVPVFGAPIFTGPVAVFTDANPFAPVEDFTVTIDWGDGTPQSAGTVTKDAVTGIFTVTGSHTYADAGVDGGDGAFGQYPVTVYIVDDGGSRLTVHNTANVEDRTIPLTGQLDPKSDSGVSQTDNITNVRLPSFNGYTEPHAWVSLVAVSQDDSGDIVIGRVEADSSGYWTMRAGTILPDGAYTIQATATDQFNVTTVTNPPSPVTIVPTLIIDTVGPKVVLPFSFPRNTGKLTVTFQDPNPTGALDGLGAPAISGLIDAGGNILSSLHDNRNWMITKPHTRPGALLFTSLVASSATGNYYDPISVLATINGGHKLRGGSYTLTISSGKEGITDVAGNQLDGEFYGYFPSGNNKRGGDFVAVIDTVHRIVFSPKPNKGYATPLDPPGTPGPGGILNHPPTPPTPTPPIFTRPRPNQPHVVIPVKANSFQERLAARQKALATLGRGK